MAAMTFTEKLDQLGARYDELTQQLSTAELVSDSAKFQKVAKQHAELEEIVQKHREFKQIEKDLSGAHQMFLEADDSEMKQMAQEEEKQLAARKEIVERDLKLLLLPKIPTTKRASSSRSAREPVATKPAFSRANYFACIRATRKPKAGKWKSWRARRLRSEG